MKRGDWSIAEGVGSSPVRCSMSLRMTKARGTTESALNNADNGARADGYVCPLYCLEICVGTNRKHGDRTALFLKNETDEKGGKIKSGRGLTLSLLFCVQCLRY